ncbi:hypothetical protein ACSBR1_029453 [Camellia fascicularis]
MVAAILQLQPPNVTAGEDTPRWIKSSDGVFSTASAYDLIVDHHNQDGDWGWIWKLKVPQKLKSFLWIVLHQKTLTNRMRNLRGLTSDPTCPFCTNVEDMEHLFWLCPQAIQIWCHVYSEDWYRSRLLLPWKDWIIYNIKGKNNTSHLFLISLWTIWKNRNNMVFAHKIINIHESVKFISDYAKEIFQAFSLDVTQPFQTKSASVWSCPFAGTIKLNTDGSNLYKRLTIIFQRGFNQVVIETDAEQVVKLLNEGPDERCPFRGIVEDTRIIMRGCDCSIQHIRREANICADAMAKLGEYQPEDLLVVNEPPAEIRTLLVADIVHLSEESSKM